MGLWNWIKENKGKVIGTTIGILLAPATGGSSLLICGGIGFGAGMILDNDTKKRSNENQKLALVGKAGEAITNQVNGLQDERGQKSNQLNSLEQAVQQKKNKLNDPNVSETEKAQIRSEIVSFVSQADKLREEIKDCDKKIEDLLKTIPGTDNKKGGLVNLESMDQQTKLILGAIILLVIYFAFIKEKER